MYLEIRPVFEKDLVYLDRKPLTWPHRAELCEPAALHQVDAGISRSGLAGAVRRHVLHPQATALGQINVLWGRCSVPECVSGCESIEDSNPCRLVLELR